MLGRVSWLFVVLFALSLAGATVMNLVLVSEARSALNEGILSRRPVTEPLRYHLAVVVPDTTDTFFDGLIEGVRQAAKASDVAVQVFRYSANAPDGAGTYFHLCLTSRVDGIILYSGFDRLMDARRAEAAAQDVVFIPVGTQAPSGKGQGFVGSSSLLQGIEGGNQAGQKLGRNARVGLILSSDGEEDPVKDPVYRGVYLALQSFPGATIVRASRARPGILSGEESASALLKSDPEINVLVCATAPITEGAAQVVVDQGRVGRVLIVGTDESLNIDRLVDKGVIAASVVRDSRRMGAEALRAFLMARGGIPFRVSVEVGFNVRTRQEQAP